MSNAKIDNITANQPANPCGRYTGGFVCKLTMQDRLVREFTFFGGERDGSCMVFITADGVLRFEDSAVSTFEISLPEAEVSRNVA